MSKLEAVRAKVHEATGVPAGSIVYGRPIMLHDVLRAIDWVRPVKQTWFIRYDGWFQEDRTGAYWAQWNLALPLDEQEPEVIEFLHKILVDDFSLRENN